ncbi:hypothetical protein R1sor_019858 [Riccia sorocarpa]|uniref:Reverse transcriptase zinc-binding domain-containing protein n=1 Tax=Riccia sorocarpa TaxID=122646 RepID=A0ABD3IEU2_9MARC
MELLREWVGGRTITDPGLWRWGIEQKTTEPTWHRANKAWKQTLIPAYKLREKFSASWGCNWDTAKWENIWKKLWQAPLYPWDKLWMWRVLNKGFLTAERTATMGVTEPACTRCNRGTENIEHMFLQCPGPAATWRELERLFTKLTGEKMVYTSLPTLVECLVKPENAPMLIRFTIFTRFSWKSRCKEVFEGKKGNVPAKTTVAEGIRIAAGIARKFTASTKCNDIQTNRSGAHCTRVHYGDNSDSEGKESQRSTESNRTRVGMLQKLAAVGFTEINIEAQGVG